MTALGGFDFCTTCERIVALALARAARRPTRRLAAGDLP
jgi:hypothetical protein